MYCKSCGKEIPDGQEFCSDCAAQNATNNASQNTYTPNSEPVYNNNYQANTNPEAKSKMAAGLLGIFLGGWGIHNFYLGYTGKAIAQIIVTFCTCGFGAIWGLIEGIMILCGSINTDANGNPLRD